MVSESTSHESCQVDFYLLGQSSTDAESLACRLALMTWEQQHEIFIVTASEDSGKRLDELMWRQPEGRFLPHAGTDSPDSARAPVKIGQLSSLNPTDVVINLCPEAIPQPERFSRVLEIVPYEDEKRQASRVKYKTYRKLGINPRTLDIK